MNIIAPANRPEEIDALIDFGANEIYCGVLSEDWQANYTNIASSTRREWKSANLKNFDQLEQIVARAHNRSVTVNLTMNALYTEGQYTTLLSDLESALNAGVDAFIVADIGFIRILRKLDKKIQIHISTGGTTFNSETVRLYMDMGADRIILPRHFTTKEVQTLMEKSNFKGFEIFIMNSGCKNIDGFCTFHHGVNEVRFGRVWDIPKGLNMDYYFQNLLRRFPKRLSKPIARSGIFRSVGACFLGYDVAAIECQDVPPNEIKKAESWISSTFDLMSGIDTCGGCSLYEWKKIGILGVKIVGRNFLTRRKIQDLKFIKGLMKKLEEEDTISKSHFESYAKRYYKAIYGLPCGERCYYPVQ